MLSNAVLNLINKQINHELYSAYLYLSMSAYFEGQNLPGFANWMRVQFHEEQEHGLKFYDYVHDQGGKVSLEAIEAPKVDFASPLEVFQLALAHEQKVTGLIKNIYKAALEEGDVATQIFLQWFISEQVEEEKNAAQIVDLLGKIGPSVGSLYQVDHQLGKRRLGGD